MAGFLSQLLPGLLAGGTDGGSSGGGGLISSLKNAAGQIFNDLGQGRVNSGADFGKSLARGVAGIFGVGGDAPKNAADKIENDISSVSNMATTNAADNGAIVNKPLADYHAPQMAHDKMEHAKIEPPSIIPEVANHPAGVPSGSSTYEFIKKDNDYYKNKYKLAKAKKKAKKESKKHK